MICKAMVFRHKVANRLWTMCVRFNCKKVKSILFTWTDISNVALEGNGNRYNTIDDQYLGSMVLQILQYFYKQ